MLDRLVGYLVTQELRRLMGKPTSAGRVQSPAVYLVVLREWEICNFKVINHFGARLNFLNEAQGSYWHAEWQPVPDFASREFPYVQDISLAQLVASTRNAIVESFEDRQAERHPPAPFISSTLRQAASNALHWDPDKTMQVAQRLYEQGVITYHRTDKGYALCSADTEHVSILYGRPLPASQYKLGPMTLSNTLQVLAGPAWQVQVDEVKREVCYELRQGFDLRPNLNTE